MLAESPILTSWWGVALAAVVGLAAVGTLVWSSTRSQATRRVPKGYRRNVEIYEGPGRRRMTHLTV